MKICVFLGSPRKKGNTAHVLNWLLEEAKNNGHKVELVYLQDQKISGCKECFACQKIVDRPGCSIKDDMQRLYPKILEADCILIATPVFTWSVSALTKAFLERTYCFEKFSEDGSYISFVEDKRCGLIVTAAGDEFEGADLVVESYRRMVEFHRMKNIGHLVVANIRTKKDLLKPNVKQAARKFASSIK
ncbi:flavodoxin family protein [bacterium]|nr:flavodoxin family protein [bacterium]